MPKRFFMRFNLQNGVNHFPATAEVGAALQNADSSEIQEYLDEFDTVQARRAERMREYFGDHLAVLNGKKVLFFGDSITSDNLGYRETVSRAAHLQSADGSISGGTSATILQFAKSKLIAEKPDLLSVMLGTNDSVGIGEEDFGSVSLGEYERNIHAILTWANEIGAKLLLFAVTPVHEARFAKHFNPQSKFQSNQNIARYNDCLRKLAQEFDIPLCEHTYIAQEEDFERLLERDGIHLNPNGHEQLALCWLHQAIQLFK